MRLHQINQLAYSGDLETTWQNSLIIGDQVLLLEEAILRTNQSAAALQQTIETKKIEIYYLQSDAIAYGLTPKVGTALSDEEWVELTFSATANITW